MRVQVTGTSPTTIRAKLWKTGTTEPTAWTLSTTDNSAGLQSAGYVGLETYASASITNSPVTLRFDNLTYATTAGTTPVTPPVTPTNAAPTAAFTSTAANLTATFDGTTSTDSDGTIASYAWNYGDGATGTSATSSHTYAAGGTYTATLTVTDNGGLTGTVSHTVTVTAPPAVPANVMAADTFMRTATNGWGTAETGGAWAMTSANANYFVSNGTGNLLVSAGGTRRGVLSALSSTATDITVQVAADKAATGGGYYIGAVGRQVGTDYYQARIRFIAGGTVGLMLMHGPSTALSNTTVAGLTYTPGQQLNLRVQTTGTSPTTVRAKVWAVGTTEPASWTLSTTDNTAGLQAAGSAGVEAYLSGSATNAPLTVTYDNLQISTVQ
jgi:PKD repeat protein